MADRPKSDSVPAGPASVDESPSPNKALVRVFDTEQESEALIVNGLLQSAGIQSDLTSLDAPQDILPGVGGTVILVPKRTPPRLTSAAIQHLWDDVLAIQEKAYCPIRVRTIGTNSSLGQPVQHLFSRMTI